MAQFNLPDFDDDLAERVKAYARQRKCSHTEWFESAAQTELANVSSRAPYRFRQSAGRNANVKLVQRGNISISVSLLNGWNVLVGKLFELPENFMRGGWGWFLAGVFSTLVYVYAQATF